MDRPSINTPDSKVHGANMGPIWGRQDPGGPHVGPINFFIWDSKSYLPITYTFRDERTSMSMIYTIQRKAFRGISKQFPHLAIAVSPRMEVKSSGHAWLDGCNFQRKRLLCPTQCRQRHSVRTEMMREIYMNSSTTTTLYFFL